MSSENAPEHKDYIDLRSEQIKNILQVYNDGLYREFLVITRIEGKTSSQHQANVKSQRELFIFSTTFHRQKDVLLQ